MNKREIECVTPAGHALNVEVMGQGSPLFLIHGFPLDASLWYVVAPTLAQAGYQVVMPNLRGFGKSSLIQGEVTVADLADDVEQLRQLICPGQSIALVGLSLGGYVALEYWRQYGGELHALVLTNTKPTTDSPEARQARLTMADKARAESTWAAVSPMLGKLLSAPTQSSQPQLLEFVQQMMSAVPPSTIYAIQHAMANRRDFSNHLASIRVPTLVMTGELDPISPAAENRHWCQSIPGAHLKIISGAAHLPPLENPDAFSQALLQWLATNKEVAVR